MKLIAVAFIIFLVGCSGVDVEKVELSKPLPVPEGVKPQVIALHTIKTRLPRGEETIGSGPNSFWDILTCKMPWGSTQSTSIGAYVIMSNIRRGFADTLEGLSYDVAGNPSLLFNIDEDHMRTRYRIGARIIDSSISLCMQDQFLRLDTRVKGAANVEIEWVVFDGLLKKTVYKTRTKGYAKIPSAMSEGAQMLLEEAFNSAAYQLGTDEKFHALIFEGIEPTITDDELGIDKEKLPPEDWSESLMIAPQKPFGQNFKAMQKATVLIENGSGGHGSGFFINHDTILTNAHVVGFAETLRVTLSGKTDYRLARLVRTDRPRDIAVLKLIEPVEDQSLYAIAPLKRGKPDVGDKVFVVGTPQYRRLQDTVTSGIVSGLRYDKRRRQTYIQSDALIHGGNSGGPMFNDKGEVIGVSILGFINRQGHDLAGLNWFIPIEDALDKLDIQSLKR
jgi:S1-C subfamily serine protease